MKFDLGPGLNAARLPALIGERAFAPDFSGKLQQRLAAAKQVAEERGLLNRL